MHVPTCRTRSSTCLSKATHGHSLSHTTYSRLLLNFAAMHLIVMSPCHSVSFEYLPKSGSAWPQSIGISHLDIARLLFQVIHHVSYKLTSTVCKWPIPGKGSLSCRRRHVSICWHSKMVILVTICLSSLPLIYQQSRLKGLPTIPSNLPFLFLSFSKLVYSEGPPFSPSLPKYNQQPFLTYPKSS